MRLREHCPGIFLDEDTRYIDRIKAFYQMHYPLLIHNGVLVNWRKDDRDFQKKVITSYFAALFHHVMVGYKPRNMLAFFPQGNRRKRDIFAEMQKECAWLRPETYTSLGKEYRA
jgi:hypothetical protein